MRIQLSEQLSSRLFLRFHLREKEKILINQGCKIKDISTKKGYVTLKIRFYLLIVINVGQVFEDKPPEGIIVVVFGFFLLLLLRITTLLEQQNRLRGMVLNMLSNRFHPFLSDIFCGVQNIFSNINLALRYQKLEIRQIHLVDG